jgi:hypothetical protein
MIKRIISGGQTGADRAALDFAIKMDLPHGGWVPKGRMSGITFMHPDDAAAFIIGELWERLSKTHKLRVVK